MKKLILLVPVIMVISLIIFLVKEVTSVSYLNISYDRAEGVRIMVHTYDKNYKEIDVGYTTNDVTQIKAIIEYVNTIPFKNSYSGRGGQTPDAWIQILDDKGKIIDDLDFYGDLLLYDGEFYKIDMKVYKQIKELCDKLSSTYSSTNTTPTAG